MAEMTDPTTDRTEAAVAARIERAVAIARAVAVFEVVWRVVAVPAVAAGAWLGLAWIGAFEAIGGWAGAIAARGGLAVVAGLGLWAMARIARVAVSRGDAAARVETASGLAAGTLADCTDRLADPAASAETQILWAAHRRARAARLGRLTAGWPRPDLPRRDVWALRPAVGLLLFVGWFAAGEDRLGRIAAAVQGPETVVVADRIDVWIDPPAHTGQPPTVVALDGEAAGASERAVRVPAGSRLVVRVAAGRPDEAPRPVAVTAEPKAALAPIETAAAGERRWSLDGDGVVRIAPEGRAATSLRVSAIADRAPTIRLVEIGTVRGRGALRVIAEVDDDWGVTAAELRTWVAEGAGGARPLYEAPTVALALPGGPRRAGRSETIRDLTAHPLAGVRLGARAVVRDAIGQEGAAESGLVLPQRAFRKPLAGALIELRRRLALDAAAIGAVRVGLDGLTLAPERFGERAGPHLGLRFLVGQANRATSDDDLRGLVDLLWTAAVTIDAGDTLDEEKALAEAREALRKALEEGASEEEIRRLTQALREAMEKWLAAKAEAARRDPDGAATGERGRRIGERDLQAMLDRIEELGRTGARKAAEELLAELGETLDALQAGRPGQGGGDKLERMGELMRRQRSLMDETHKAERDGASPGERSRLAERQDRLRDDLRRLSREIGREGAAGEAPAEGEDGTRPGPGQALDEADGAMGEAGRALDRAEGGEALDAQGRALEAMRRGARALADRQNGETGRDGAERGGPEEDPLGRPRRSRDASSRGVKIPEAIDVERARRILDDIRRRLADPERPRFERDYLDRLLRLE